jgi:hypothetical protein
MAEPIEISPPSVTSCDPVPEPEDLAQIRGFQDGAAMTADFMRHLTSTDFC